MSGKMEQITIKLDVQLLKKMKARMSKTGCSTLSKCARELLDLALRIEEAAEANSDKNDTNQLDPELINLFKLTLTWQLESRFLLRFLIENGKEIENINVIDYMDRAKERAADAVAELITRTVNGR